MNKVSIIDVEFKEGKLMGTTDDSNMVISTHKIEDGYLPTQISLQDATLYDRNVKFNSVSGHVVYKILDNDDNIIYIGKSCNGGISSRLRAHLNGQQTFKDYHKVKVYLAVFINEADCLIYEQYLIALYRPLLNIEKPQHPSSLPLLPPKFELYATVDIEDKQQVKELTKLDQEELIKNRYGRIKSYCKKLEISYPSYSDFHDHVINDRIDLNNTGIGVGCWKFNYEELKYFMVE